MRRFNRSILIHSVALFGLMAISLVAFGDDAFYRIALNDIKLTDGKLPQPKTDRYYSNVLEPQVRLDATNPREAEAYFTYGDATWSTWYWRNPRENQIAIVLRAPAGKDITGRIYVPSEDWKSLVELKFRVSAKNTFADSRLAFLEGKAKHYNSLQQRNLPGAAWFRHRAEEARTAGPPGNNPIRLPQPDRRDELENSYELFSGGRAISENLQLDRVLIPRTDHGDNLVSIETLKGITIAEMDWKLLITGKAPATDPLATRIPIDQHAIFFQTFEAMTSLVDEAERQGTPVLQYAEPRSEDARTKQRYQRQLCLPLTGLGRMLGPKLISGIAVTGSDPYLRVGSDIAILFEPKDLPSLQGLLGSQMALASGGGHDAGQAAAVNGKVGDVAYTGFVSPDRSVCSYLATVGDTVVVTNSLAQLQQLADVQSGKTASIRTAPEYTFFRDRYVRGEAGESGFIVLTDATIRRWCSPRWRIADSRRTRAAAVMAEMQAKSLTELVNHKVEPGKILTDTDYGIGELRLTADGVTSSIYGTLQFMTPIIELDIAKVTKTEADSYNRWRDSYQQNWRNYFDPIAVRFTATSKMLNADMTVMPLIAASEYGQIIAISKGAKILPGSGDPHDALLHLALAVNTQSETVKGYGGMVSSFIPQLKIDPFSWIGQTIAFYVDDDPIWEEASKAESRWDYLESHIDKVPAAIYIESINALKLTAFLTGLHAYIDQSAPGMTIWETKTYNDVPYVKIASSPQAKANSKEMANAAIYYTTAAGALLITPNEDLMKRSLDRAAARVAAAAPGAKPPATQPHPWLGDNYCLQVGGPNLTRMLRAWLFNNSTEMQDQAWGNLPILNEWKQLFPDQDPVKLHERLWQTRLVDPAGGTYVWNEKFQTMESTIFGCPEAPKTGPMLPTALDSLQRASFGVTFEGQGLRARAELHRAEVTPAPPKQ